MEDIMRVLQNIQTDLTSQKKDMKEMEQNIKDSINKNIDEKFNRIESRTHQLEQKIEEQQKFINILDRQIRKKNIVFFGMDETERSYEDLLELILDVIQNKIKISCNRWEIESVSRIGKKTGKKRPIVATLSTMSKKIELLRNKKTLENTEIYLKEDYSPQVLVKRKELQEQIKREHESGKKVALRYDRIVTLKQSTVEHTSNEKISKKRVLSESPEADMGTHSKAITADRTKQTAKKNKPQNIIGFLRPSQLNTVALASTSYDKSQHSTN